MVKRQKIFLLNNEAIELLEKEAEKRKISQSKLINHLIEKYIKVDDVIEEDIIQFKKMISEEDIWKFINEGMDYKQIAERTQNHPEAVRICLDELLEKWHEEEKKRLKNKYSKIYYNLFYKGI